MCVCFYVCVCVCVCVYVSVRPKDKNAGIGCFSFLQQPRTLPSTVPPLSTHAHTHESKIAAINVHPRTNKAPKNNLPLMHCSHMKTMR